MKVLLCAAFVLAVSLLSFPPVAALSDDSLASLSLEELMAVEVTSVGKRTQKLSEAAAAVYVITQQDLRRSGVTSIPEALRMVPGLHVARINGTQWAITSRGFNGGFANKLLVLIDGRTVYSPLFSGVYWDVQDVLLEDVERIEVVRGPGATLWGANAVNGVINVITRHSNNTQGTLATILVGTQERQLAVRHGGTFGSTGTFRLYGKGKGLSEGEDEDGIDSRDAMTQGRMGFRMDWLNARGDDLTLQGDLYRSVYDNLVQVKTLATFPAGVEKERRSDAEGGNLLFRWQDDAGRQLQLYYDRADRKELAYQSEQNTLDVDWQQRFSLGERHSLIGGVGYRRTWDRLRTLEPELLGVDAEAETLHLFNVFLQDDITLFPEQLVLTLGTKLEHNSYTQFELQPNARLAWTPAPSHTLWAAVSRAVRTPSRGERTSTIVFETVVAEVGPLTLPLETVVHANSDYESEELVAFEAGYRYLPRESFSVDFTAFLNRYDHLRTVEFVGLTTNGLPPASATADYTFGNKARGKSLGVELAVNWQATPWWRMQASYSYLNMLIELESDSTDQASVPQVYEAYPHHQGSLRSHWTLAPKLSLDLWLRAVGAVENQQAGGYVTLDANLGWHINDRLELSLVGQNLIGGGHKEFESEFLQGRGYEVRPSAYLQLRWEL